MRTLYTNRYNAVLLAQLKELAGIKGVDLSRLLDKAIALYLKTETKVKL